MANQTTHTINTHTYAGIEVKLIKRHMALETTKIVLGIIIYVLLFIGLIINAISPETFNSATLGYIAAGNSLMLASVKIKNIKEILNFSS